MRLNVYAEQDFCRNSIGLYLVERQPSGTFVGKPVEMEAIREEPRGEWREPTVRLPMEVAQELMDRLWQCGVRPTEGAGSAGAMRQAEAHIESLRHVAYALLPPKPGG